MLIPEFTYEFRSACLTSIVVFLVSCSSCGRVAGKWSRICSLKFTLTCVDTSALICCWICVLQHTSTRLVKMVMHKKDLLFADRSSSATWSLSRFLIMCLTSRTRRSCLRSCERICLLKVWISSLMFCLFHGSQPRFLFNSSCNPLYSLTVEVPAIDKFADCVFSVRRVWSLRWMSQNNAWRKHDIVGMYRVPNVTLIDPSMSRIAAAFFCGGGETPVIIWSCWAWAWTWRTWADIVDEKKRLHKQWGQSRGNEIDGLQLRWVQWGDS